MSNARRLTAPLLVVLMGAVAAQNAPALYRDPGRPVDERVADLLGRMTIEEKVAQLEGLWKRNAQLQQPDGRFNPATAATLLSNGIGEIARPSEIANPPAGAPSVRTARP